MTGSAAPKPFPHSPEEITGDLDKKQGSMVFVLDVPFYKGTMKML